ncbi:Cutinase transcription factor 1 alpha [Colletotrichum spinosum]|uniref:Cutinase transcription factor 1 alpha n=1 Tax=Colletotrichum spinosum TaxID=1347390 RepID=A0A4R8Q923_9PEZI|nr:Cutinase transcription factor 1 alpha [Colletotrichum spinosum]
MLGFTVGGDGLIQEAGFIDRATARRTHYLRAKALYDADYDNDRLNIAAALLLLGFWWAGLVIATFLQLLDDLAASEMRTATSNP